MKYVLQVLARKCWELLGDSNDLIIYDKSFSRNRNASVVGHLYKGQVVAYISTSAFTKLIQTETGLRGYVDFVDWGSSYSLLLI